MSQIHLREGIVLCGTEKDVYSIYIKERDGCIHDLSQIVQNWRVSDTIEIRYEFRVSRSLFLESKHVMRNVIQMINETYFLAS